MLSDAERTVGPLRRSDFLPAEVYRVNATDPEGDRRTQEQFQDSMKRQKKDQPENAPRDGEQERKDPRPPELQDKVTLESVPGQPPQPGETPAATPPEDEPPPPHGPHESGQPTGRIINIVI